MKINKKQREKIKQKFGGLCAYSGTLLEDDWQVDHIKPIIRNWYNGSCVFPEAHSEDNLVPCQRIINHYKGSMSLQDFREWYLGGLHERIKKLPKNPRTEKGRNRKNYLLKVAGYFGITESEPFSGIFYYETIVTQTP